MSKEKFTKREISRQTTGKKSTSSSPFHFFQQNLSNQWKKKPLQGHPESAHSSAEDSPLKEEGDLSRRAKPNSDQRTEIDDQKSSENNLRIIPTLTGEIRPEGEVARGHSSNEKKTSFFSREEKPEDRGGTFQRGENDDSSRFYESKSPQEGEGTFGGGENDDSSRFYESKSPQEGGGSSKISQETTYPTEGELSEELFKPGDKIGDKYIIKRKIGTGGMSYVYLARDLRLGRNVALKFIHRKYFHSPEAIDRFLDEARSTAQLNHPNIVAVYEANKWEGIPYVALEYIRGKTLREKLNESKENKNKDGKLPLGEALRIALSISKAIQRAHKAGLVHCDLKPENILITRDGIVKVLDFGLAKKLTFFSEEKLDLEDSFELDLENIEELMERTDWPRVSRIKGTPAYMAPEQWRQGSPLTPATDVWALGVILYEMLAGKRPFTGSTVLELHEKIQRDPPPPLSGGVPSEVSELIDKCLRKSPARRISTTELPEYLEQLLFSYRSGYQIDENYEPFIGLQPFDRTRAHLFFGRNKDLDSFFERLREQPVVPIIGPSGAGKTSFVMAGVIPRLLEQGRWIIIQLNSYRDPFSALAKQLLSTLRDNEISEGFLRIQGAKGGKEAPLGLVSTELKLAQSLREKPRLLSIILYRLAEEKHKNIALILDQLENLLISTDAETRKLFTSALAAVAEDPLDPLRVIFTLRDDFIGRFADNRDAQDMLERVFILRTPDAEALKEILVKPISHLRYKYSSEKFIHRIIQEIEGEPAGLPLLQIAGQILWENRDKESKTLLEEVYDRIGGVGGALTKHADGVLEKIPPSQRNIAKQIFLRLIEPEGIRRPLPKRELMHGLPPEAENVLKILISQRLLSIQGSEREAGEPIVELIHDSLIQRWTTLNRWLNESKNNLKFLRELEQVAEMWHKRGRRISEVWTGEALQEALAFRKRYPYSLPPKVEEFLDKGVQIEKRRQRLKKTIYFSAAGLLSILLVISLWIALIFKRQKEAISRRWALSQQHAARSAMIRGDFLSAYALLRTALEHLDTPFLRALWRRLQISPIYWEKKLNVNLRSLLFLEEQSQMVIGGHDGALFSIDLHTGEKKNLQVHKSPVLALAYSRQLRLLASASWDGKVALWKYSEGRPVRWKLLAVQTPHKTPIRTLLFHPRTPVLLAASFSGVKAWRITSRQPRTSLPFLREIKLPPELSRKQVYSARFSSGGEYLAIGTYSKKVFVYYWAKNKLLPVKLPAKGQVSDFHFIPDSPIFFAVGTLPELIAISAKTLGVKTFPSRHTNAVTSLAIEKVEGDTYLATASLDSTVNIWKLSNYSSLKELQLTFYNTLRGHSNAVYQIKLSPKKKLLASVGEDQTVKLWRFFKSEERIRSTGHQNKITSLTFFPLGNRVVSASNDKTIRIWDTDTGRELLVIRGHKNTINRVAISPDGTRIISSSYDNTIRIWNINEEEKGFFKFREIYRFYRYRLPTSNNPFSLEGDKISMLRGSLIYIWDLFFPIRSHFWNAATILPPIEEPKSKRKSRPIYQTASSYLLQDAAFHPTKPQIATLDTGRRIRLWRLSDHRFLREFIAPRPIYELHIDPTGKYLFALSLNAEIFLWKLDQKKKFIPKPDRILRGHRIYITSFTPGPLGLMALSTDRNGNAFLWKLEENKKIKLEEARTFCSNAAIRPDGKELSYVCRGNSLLVLWNFSKNCREQILKTPPNRLVSAEVRKKCRRQFYLYDDKIVATQYHPLNRSLAFGTSEGKLYLWDSRRARPHWWSSLFAPPLDLSFSQRGWEYLSSPKPFRWPDSALPQWAKSLENSGQKAQISPRGKYIAICDRERHLSIWNLTSGRREYRAEVATDIYKFAVTDGGNTYFISYKKLWKIDKKGKLSPLKDGVSALYISENAAIFAGKSGVWFLAEGGKKLRRKITLQRQIEPSALYLKGNKLFVGYKTGYFELFEKRAGKWRRAKKFPPLLSTPLSAVASILPGPNGILILGFDDGHVGIWSLKNGNLLEKIRLHGKVSHLALIANRLIASTNLGDLLRWNLSVYSQPYCKILGEVWRKVSIVWKKGRLIFRRPPKDHPCAPEFYADNRTH